MAGASSAPQCFMKKEIEMDKVVCRFYVNSECEDGDKCQFPHVPKEGKLLDSACRFFLKSKCHFGKLCALDHVNITDRNGKKVVQIIQQQFGARKRNLESLNITVQDPPSSNANQQANLVEELGEVFGKIVLSPKSEAANCSILSPSKPYANKQYLTIGSIKPNISCEEWKIHDAGSPENNLQDFCRGGTLQKPESSENFQHLLKGLTRSDLKRGDHQRVKAIAAESESKDLRSWGISQVPVHNLSTKRSEVEQHPTIGFIKSDSKHEERIPGGKLVAENRSQASGSGAASQKTWGGFDPNKPMVLYNTAVVPRGRTAEEIALFGEFSLFPMDSRSRVPLYMRGVTPRQPSPEYVGKQTENAKKVEETFVSKQKENDENAGGNNGESLQQNIEEKYIYSPSGRRVGLHPQFVSSFPYQDKM